MTETIKILTSEQITDFLKQYLSKFQGFNGITKDIGDINVAVLLTSDSVGLLNEINKGLPEALNQFIEKDLKDNCKKYNRSITYYESEERDTSLILRWV